MPRDLVVWIVLGIAVFMVLAPRTRADGDPCASLKLASAQLACLDREQEYQKGIEPSLESVQSVLGRFVCALFSVVISFAMQVWGWRDFDYGRQVAGIGWIVGGVLTIGLGLAIFGFGWPWVWAIS